MMADMHEKVRYLVRTLIKTDSEGIRLLIPLSILRRETYGLVREYQICQRKDISV